MAGTILATAGVVFTLLTLPLSTVAAQYGSRLLRVFLGIAPPSFVLGMFVATFVYCLASALSIPPIEVEPDGPQITATVGLYLMLATFASLILLVQHISTMLQAPNIAAAAGAELRDVVLAEVPEQAEEREGLKEGSKILPDSLVEKEGYPIRVTQSGSIQYIDPEYILTLAQENDLIIRLLRKPGHIVWRGYDRSPLFGLLKVSMRNWNIKSVTRFELEMVEHLPRMLPMASTSSLKWQYEPCHRRSMIHSQR